MGNNSISTLLPLFAILRVLRGYLVLAAAVSGLLISSVAYSAPPAISQISLRGLRTGGTTRVAIDGSDLMPGAELVLPLPIAHQAVRPGGGPQHVEFDVALDASVVPGIYNLRVVTPGGISNAVAIGVDSLMQAPLGPQTATLPAALSGTLAGGQTAETLVVLSKGQPIVVEVEARRLGAAIDPVLHVLDERNIPLGWAEGKDSLGGDARLTFIAPAAGRYQVQLHDATYQAGNPGQFRLKIGQFYYADLAFPPAVQLGTKATIEFASTNLPSGTKLELAPPVVAGSLPAPWPASLAVSGFRPVLMASELTEVIQSPPADSAASALQQVTAPVGISGRLAAPREDQYRVAIEPGAKLRLEVTAARIGSPLDAILMVRDEQGHQLASNDDQPDTVDPGLDFTVPDDRHALVVALKDVAGRSGPDFVYHLAITRLDRPDFSLTLDTDRLNIPLSGSGLLRVEVVRRNYTGPIKLALPNLPSGWKVANDEIRAGDDEVLVSIAAAGASAGHPLISVTGTALDGPIRRGGLTRTALGPPDRAEAKSQPWLRAELALAVSVQPAINITWAEPSEATSLKPGAKLPVKLKLMRGSGATGSVRLALVTTQRTPLKTIRVNNAPKQVPAPERTLRLEGNPEISAAASEAIVQLIVPADVPPRGYNLAVRAELLTADGQRVEATTYTPVLRAEVPPPAPKKPVDAKQAKS